MSQALRIGVDLMGGETSPTKLLDAVLDLSPLYLDSVTFYLFGIPSVFEKFSKKNPPSNVAFIEVENFIGMDENPLSAIRTKKNSSICKGMHFLQSKKIDAFVSCGNTGALVTAAKTIVGMLPKILRPALVAWMPTKKQPLAVLDIGANVQIGAKHLVQFAQMGASFVKKRKKKIPKVGLLNIGSEKLKGTTLLQEAFEILTAEQKVLGFHFAGNVEGNDVFQGEVDVLITDGFTGNIFLKTAEGIASLIVDRLEEFSSLAPHLDDLRNYLHYAKYPGSILLGLKALVIKCHSYCTANSFINAIKDTIYQFEHNCHE